MLPKHNKIKHNQHRNRVLFFGVFLTILYQNLRLAIKPTYDYEYQIKNLKLSCQSNLYNTREVCFKFKVKGNYCIVIVVHCSYIDVLRQNQVLTRKKHCKQATYAAIQTSF